MALAFLVALQFIGGVIAALLPTNARNAECTWAGLVGLVCVLQVALLFPSATSGGVIRQNIVRLPSVGLNLVSTVEVGSN
jgi:multicomponent K+:H+ antiporter subunit A